MSEYNLAEKKEKEKKLQEISPEHTDAPKQG